MNFLAIPYAIFFAPIYVFWMKNIFCIEVHKKRWISYYIGVALCMGVPTLLIPHNNWRWLFIMGILCICTFLILKSTFFKSLIYIIIINIFLIFSETIILLVAVAVIKNYDDYIVHIQQDGIAINLLTWLSFLIITSMVYFTRARKKEYSHSIKINGWVIVAEIIAFAIIYFITYTMSINFVFDVIVTDLLNNVSGWAWLFIGSTPVLIIGIVFFLYIEKKKTQKHLEEIVELQKSSFALYDNSREFAHDYKNLMLYFQGCVENGDYEKMKDVVDEKLADAQTAYNSSYKIDLNNIEDTGIRWILVSKISEAIQNGVTFEVSAFEKVDWIIKKNEVIDILGILTDNALESAIHSEKRKIVLSLKNEENGYTLSISNTLGEKPEISKLFDKNYTTKENHSGIGLNKVKKICDKYENIFLNVTINNDIFAISIKST